MKVKYNRRKLEIEFDDKEREKFDKLFFSEEDEDISREEFIKKRFNMTDEELDEDLCIVCDKDNKLILHPIYRKRKLCIDCLHSLNWVVLAKITAMKEIGEKFKSL